MNQNSLKLLRFGYVILFAWFGVMQLLYPQMWLSYLPEWIGYLPIPGEMLVTLNGWFEIIAAIMLLVGVQTRIISFILGLHLFFIAYTAGGAVGMRDFVLGILGVSIAMNEVDDWTLDSR